MEAEDGGRDALGDLLVDVGAFGEAAELLLLFETRGEEVVRADGGVGGLRCGVGAVRGLRVDLNADNAQVGLTNADVELVLQRGLLKQTQTRYIWFFGKNLDLDSNL